MITAEQSNNDVSLEEKQVIGGFTLRLLHEFDDLDLSKVFPQEKPPLVWSGRVNELVNERFRRFTGSHGRATFDAIFHKVARWSDGFNHVYMGRDFKGNIVSDFSQLQIKFDNFSPTMFRFVGLLDATGCFIKKKNSKLLRQSGIPTEAMVRQWIITEVPYAGEVMSTEEALVLVIGNIINDDQKINQLCEQARQAGELKYAKKEVLLEALVHLVQADFLVVERHVPVIERTWDILWAKDLNQLWKTLEPAFIYLNTVAFEEKGQHPGFIPLEKKLEIGSLSDLRFYAETWLPQQMGWYLAQLHNRGFTHNYAHGQNWATVGILYDLDSLLTLSPEAFQSAVQYDLYRTLRNGVFDKVMEQIRRLSGDSINTSRALEEFLVSYFFHRYQKTLVKLKQKDHARAQFLQAQINELLLTVFHHHSEKDIRIFSMDKYMDEQILDSLKQRFERWSRSSKEALTYGDVPEATFWSKIRKVW